MKRGCFCKKNTFEIINPEDIEKELPESFLVDSMKKYKYPKYEYICLLRAITSEDGMTADFFNFKKDFMQRISNKIVNNIKGINRVVYDTTTKPPSTIELE